MNTWDLNDSHKKQIPEWNARWIDIIMQTGEIDLDKVRPHINGLYAAANLPTVPVIRVKSPMMGAIVCCAAAVYWRHAGATLGATDDASSATRDVTSSATARATLRVPSDATSRATRDVTSSATARATLRVTSDATSRATYDATSRATDDASSATLGATRDVTSSATARATLGATAGATLGVTYDATRSVTYDATRSATYDATADATDCVPLDANGGMVTAAVGVVNAKLGKDVSREIMKEMGSWFGYRNGGNEWASWCCFTSFVRDVIGWRDPSHEQYRHYEGAAIHGGHRYMHSHFCLVSDFPVIRRFDDQGKLDSPYGLPAIEWGCGTEAFYSHGGRLNNMPEFAGASQGYDNTPVDRLIYADLQDEAGNEDFRKVLTTGRS